MSDLIHHAHQETTLTISVGSRCCRVFRSWPGIAWSDVNGDGRPDLLVGGGRSGSSAFLNDGTGISMLLKSRLAHKSDHRARLDSEHVRRQRKRGVSGRIEL